MRHLDAPLNEVDARLPDMTRAVDNLALAMLMGDQTLLNIAREVTAAIEASGAEGAIVGGIAVFLHGYHRTTNDIDVFTHDTDRLRDELERRGFVWNPEARQFEKAGVPVQLLTTSELRFVPSRFEEQQGIRIVSLGDLISMKLASGTHFVHRSQDLADVVQLVQALALDGRFSSRVTPELRAEFRKLVQALKREGRL